MISALIFLLLLVVAGLMVNRWIVILWWRFQFRRYTLRARKAKAIWLATKESMKKGSGGPYDPWAQTEGNYCDALVKMRTYEKLLGPMGTTPGDTKAKAKTK